MDELERYLTAWTGRRGRPRRPVAMAAMDRSERFGWLVAPASGLLQPSDVHTGLSADPAATLDDLAAALSNDRARLLASRL